MTDKDIIDSGDFTNNAKDNPIQKIKVIGVGGGGNNAVMHMHRKGIKDVSFILINTDRAVLESSKMANTVLIGPGQGAGGDPEKARKYAEENAERIAELFDDKTDMVFITAGMGGGTGTGAAPVVARIAKERGILTVGIVTLPFKFEGRKKALKALNGADEMAKYVDSLLIINNERLTEIYHNLDILNAFSKADDTLLIAAQSIADVITYTGIVNRDFNDVKATLQDGGTAIISTGFGEGEDRVTKAIQDALHSPLLKNTDIFGSKKLLMILYIDDNREQHTFNMDEVSALTEFVAGIEQEEDVDVLWGLYPKSGLGDKVRITILASGFDVSVNGAKPLQKKKKAEEPENIDDARRIDETYGPSKVSHDRGVILNPDMYDNPDSDGVREIEQQPAINRNPYRKYMAGATTYRQPRHNPDNELPRAQKQDIPDNKADEKGNMLLNFDDC